MAVHSHRFTDGVCECGKTYEQVAAERAGHATGRRRVSEAEAFAQDRQRQIVNESRRERRRFHGGK